MIVSDRDIDFFAKKLKISPEKTFLLIQDPDCLPGILDKISEEKLEGINDYIKKQEDLLLSWNKKIEDAKQRAELESFLKTIDKQLTKFEKEKQIRVLLLPKTAL